MEVNTIDLGRPANSNGNWVRLRIVGPFVEIARVAADGEKLQSVMLFAGDVAAVAEALSSLGER